MARAGRFILVMTLVAGCLARLASAAPLRTSVRAVPRKAALSREGPAAAPAHVHKARRKRTDTASVAAAAPSASWSPDGPSRSRPPRSFPATLIPADPVRLDRPPA